MRRRQGLGKQAIAELLVVLDVAEQGTGLFAICCFIGVGFVERILDLDGQTLGFAFESVPSTEGVDLRLDCLRNSSDQAFVDEFCSSLTIAVEVYNLCCKV